MADRAEDRMQTTTQPARAPERCCVCRTGTELAPVRTYEKDGRAYRLFECAACAVQFWYPNEIADSHLYDNPSGVGAVGKLPPLTAFRPPQLDFLKAYAGILRGARLVDVGCGDGGFMFAAAQRGAQVWGVDYNAAAIARARQGLGLDTAVCMTLEEFTANPTVKEIDIVTAFEVVEHVADPIGLIRSVGALVRPGGYVVASVPSRERLLHDLSTWDYPPHHLTRWNEAAIRRAFEAGGLSVERVIYQRRFITILKELADAAHVGLLWGVLRLRYRNFTTGTPKAFFVYLVAHACSWAAEAALVIVFGIPAAILAGISAAKGLHGTSMLIVARKGE
jgi:2-polyprenyl-3-methyl-5-hydroxy-6-metoxy-1,4-benzoquinol methylase